MIKLHLGGNKGIMDLDIKGKLPELIADTLTILNMIHSTIQEQNKMEAEYYKQCILSEIETAFIHDNEMLKVALDNKALLSELRKAKLDENS